MYAGRRKLFFVFLAFIMAFQPVMNAGMAVFAQESAETKDQPAEAEKQVKIAVISDIHYVVDKQRSDAGEQALQTSSATEMRMLEEIDTILSAALDQANDWEPDVLLACGDLLSNGELVGARALSEKLKAAKKDGLADTGIYVVNGNHDINNSYAEDFSKENYWEAERVLPADFKANFSGLGYGEEDSYDRDPSRHEFYQPTAGDPAGGLSYVTEIADGITLIVLDTGIYSTDPNLRYGGSQKTGGKVSPGLLNWAVEKAQDAKAKGNLVLAMSHHALMPHYTEEVADKDINWYMGEFIVEDWKNTANALADAGVSAIFTGHIHSSDIAYHVSDNGNVIYDIQTAPLAAYPVAWRMLTIGISGTGTNKSYSFSIATKFLDKDFDDYSEKTAGWKVNTGTLDEPVYKTFAEYDGSMQDYSKDKTGGYYELNIKPAIDYMMRSLLYEYVGTTSLREYLLENLLMSDDLKQAIEDLMPLLMTWIDGQIPETGLSFSFAYDGKNYTATLLKASAAKAAEDQKVTLNVKVSNESETVDFGTITVDLSFLPDYADRLVSRIDEEFDKPDWKNNNYDKQNQLINELVDLTDLVFTSVVTMKLDENDPDSTPLQIISDAGITYCRGDEALASAEQKAKWETWNNLLKSESLSQSISDNVWKGLTTGAANPYNKYKTVSGILNVEFFTDPDSSLVTVKVSGQTYSGDLEFLNMVTMLFEDTPEIGKSLEDVITYASGIIELIKMFSGTVIRIIPPSYFDTVGKMLADYQKALTNDRNIPNDSQWEFYTVSFDSGGGSRVTPASALTVEDGKLAVWPEDPTRMGCTFAGWFDAARGGNEITEDSVFTGPVTLYAQWLSDRPAEHGSDFDPWFFMPGTELPATGFSSGHFTPLGERPLDLVYKPTGHTLQIPELGISETILTVPLTDGRYPVEWLGSQIGLLEGSSLPGKGVAVLTGHNHLNTTEAGPFLSIGTLNEGDRIMISNARGAMLTYQVYGNHKIASDSFADIAAEVHDNAIVLITCEDESAAGGYLNRRVILAEPL